MATVTDYNPLMKDFPINDLLAATELERIRTSVQTIFTHLRKIRNTKYPIQRALRLVEAISRDLVNQMLKVLNTRRLMFISFEEFEKVMLLCVDVFATWDDEYDRLQVRAFVGWTTQFHINSLSFSSFRRRLCLNTLK